MTQDKLECSNFQTKHKEHVVELKICVRSPGWIKGESECIRSVGMHVERKEGILG